MLKQFSLLPLHINHTVSLSNIRIPIDKFPTEDGAGNLFVEKSTVAIARLIYGKKMFEGGYGNVYICKRLEDGKSTNVMVKKAKNGQINLGEEGTLQWIARNTLKNHSLESAIPEVYDIFISGKSLSFSMELIEGDFPYVYLAKVENPDEFFFQILAQVSVLLYFLEIDIFLDHRDLKANNLYIRERPVDYKVTIEGVTYHIKAPFQVLLLDFGFACIGDESGKTKINIADGIFPLSDPCPKEGRDLFHLITSFWSIPSIRERMSEATQKEVDGWLRKDTKDFSKLARKLTQTDWVYIVTGDPKFKYPKLKPLTILKVISGSKPRSSSSVDV
jgi:serine/threonine protein kinase